MLTLKISGVTQRNIALCVGKPFESIVCLSPDDEIRLINNNIGKNVSFSKIRDSRKVGRGNPLLSRKKIKTINDVESRLARIK